MIEKIRKSFLAGIITIIPIALTVYVLQAIFNISLAVGGKIAEPLKNIVNADFIGFNLLTSIAGLFVVLITLIIVGFFARNVLGKRVVNWIEGIFKKIPLISMIYTTTKQIIESISGTTNNSFQKVVYIEYPRKRLWTLGFVTNESSNKENEKFYHLFIPTTPNPTSGYFLVIPIEDALDAEISVEEGFRMIISSGIASSNKIPISK